MVTLDKVLNGIDVVSFAGNRKTVISGIIFDSRKVTEGSLFVAVKGTKSDGHEFIELAAKSGASAIICERLPGKTDEKICWIVTNDSSTALGIAASNYYGNPSSLLKLTGVTGTNGKTTIATLLYRMFTGLGYKCGLFSTVCNYIVDKELAATHTTPDPVQLNMLLAEMVESGCEYAFMEVSSHAVDQKRIAGLRFSGGIFTNLTHDHLDYHKTFDNYLAAKKRFFDLLSDSAFALTNNDARNGISGARSLNSGLKEWDSKSTGKKSGQDSLAILMLQTCLPFMVHHYSLRQIREKCSPSSVIFVQLQAAWRQYPLQQGYRVLSTMPILPMHFLMC
jgi:UDP-N-acetylmuramoyl-L-alanyl-D-glutamate--2,6-diaminopimelate ligase